MAADELSAIDDMLFKLLATNPTLSPDDLTPDMIAKYMAEAAAEKEKSAQATTEAQDAERLK